MVLKKNAQIFISICFLVIASAVYFSGIDGRHIPKNGDEEVYLRIARLTALQGHWLPLQSDLNNMRNTKPPLLFWQGIVSSHWGKDFRFWILRYPNVIYTLLTSILIAWLTIKIAFSCTQNAWIKGAYAALIWLSFWSTFRYGRPFLTASPEVFWMFCPLVILLGKGTKGLESQFFAPISIGIFLGLGFLTQSFALLMPAGLAIASIYLMYRHWNCLNMLKKDGYKLFTIGFISVGLFSLWLFLDPQPEAIWREFIIGENIGKIANTDGAINYFKGLFLGHDSILNLLVGLLLNTGLFLLPIFTLVALTYQQRNKLLFEQKALWLWIIIWFLTFSLPAQRSSRYLMPTMPCLAILLVLSWDTLKSWVFKLSHALGLVLILGISYADYCLLTMQGFSVNMRLILISGVIFFIAFLCSIVGIIYTRTTRQMLPFTILAIFASLTCLFAPINYSHFSEHSQALVKSKYLAVPSNFRAGHESYQFDFPKAIIVAYIDNDQKNTLQRLLDKNEFVIWRSAPSDTAPNCINCIIIDSRFEFLGRQDKNQFKTIVNGKLSDILAAREWLIQRA